jgi:hypothetical protein
MQIFLGKRAFFNHGTAVSHLFVQLATIFSFQISNFALVFFKFLDIKTFWSLLHVQYKLFIPETTILSEIFIVECLDV